METISIALACTILGACIGYLNFQRNKDKDTKEDGKNQGITAFKLDYISNGINEIRLDLKAQDRKIEDIHTRLVKVEESSKSAHHRIDSLEEGK